MVHIVHGNCGTLLAIGYILPQLQPFPFGKPPCAVHVPVYTVACDTVQHSLSVFFRGQAITTLQSAARLKRDEEVTGEDILEIAGVSFECTDFLHETTMR